jgi:hypothetical protein
MRRLIEGMFLPAFAAGDRRSAISFFFSPFRFSP